MRLRHNLKAHARGEEVRALARTDPSASPPGGALLHERTNRAPSKRDARLVKKLGGKKQFPVFLVFEPSCERSSSKNGGRRWPASRVTRAPGAAADAVDAPYQAMQGVLRLLRDHVPSVESQYAARCPAPRSPSRMYFFILFFLQKKRKVEQSHDLSPPFLLLRQSRFDGGDVPDLRPGVVHKDHQRRQRRRQPELPLAARHQAPPRTLRYESVLSHRSLFFPQLFFFLPLHPHFPLTPCDDLTAA
jgi:hypothetical protein